jgi:hypothetical protein
MLAERMLLLCVVGLVGLLVFLTLIFSLDSDVTTGYYDRFGADINKFFTGKVTVNLINSLARYSTVQLDGSGKKWSHLIDLY